MPGAGIALGIDGKLGMPDMTDDLFARQPFGVAALAKMAPVPENFRLYSAGWVDDKPEVMRVVGA